MQEVSWHAWSRSSGIFYSSVRATSCVPRAIRNVVSQASRAFWGMTQTDLATHHRRLSLTASIDVQAANTTGLGTWVRLEGIGVSAGEGRR